VTYIVVISAVAREFVTRESGCIFALVFAGGSALSMLRRLPRVVRRAGRAYAGAAATHRACA
jgi:hypothetical protein